MITATFVLAVIGVVLSLLSLGWQIASHVLTGPRVRITVKAGLAGPGGSITWDPGRRPASEQLLGHIDDGYTRPVVWVGVRNVGRMPASVHAIRFDQGKTNYRPVADILAGPPMPARVETHDTVEWLIAAEGLRTAMLTAQQVLDAPARVTPVVETGTGEHVRGPRQVVSDDLAVVL